MAKSLGNLQKKRMSDGYILSCVEQLTKRQERVSCNKTADLLRLTFFSVTKTAKK